MFGGFGEDVGGRMGWGFTTGWSTRRSALRSIDLPASGGAVVAIDFEAFDCLGLKDWLESNFHGGHCLLGT